MVEAYVGAMFVDSDFDFRVVQGFFDSHIRWFFEDMRIYDGFANNSPIVSYCGEEVMERRTDTGVEQITRIFANIDGLQEMASHGTGESFGRRIDGRDDCRRHDPLIHCQSSSDRQVKQSGENASGKGGVRGTTRAGTLPIP